jgi:hypothetical protein
VRRRPIGNGIAANHQLRHNLIAQLKDSLFMRSILSSIAVISVLAIGACTTPQVAHEASAAPRPAAARATASTAAAAKPANANEKAGLICATHQVTGSLMPVRECHTAEAWAEIRRHGQDSFSLEAQRHMPSTGGN